MARARMTRQELKTQDEITTTLQRFTEFAIARKRELLFGGGALLLVVLIAVAWNFYSTRRNAAAQAQLGSAITAFTDPAAKSDKERYEKTIAEAQKTIDSYGSLPAGVIAKYYVGLSQAGLGDNANAIKTLQEVTSRGDENIRPVAEFALAGVYKRTGDVPKAIETLKTLHDSGGVYSKAVVALELGMLHEINKQPDQAKNYYNEVIASADSILRPAAEAGLKRMGFQPAEAPPAVAPAAK